VPTILDALSSSVEKKLKISKTVGELQINVLLYYKILMAKKINKPDQTPKSGEIKQKEITIERAKALLSKRNTSKKLQIVQ